MTQPNHWWWQAGDPPFPLSQGGAGAIPPWQAPSLLVSTLDTTRGDPRQQPDRGVLEHVLTKAVAPAQAAFLDVDTTSLSAK